jgi:hypothetical protein
MTLTKEVNDELYVKITPQTIHNRLYDIGLDGRVGRKKPFISTLNRINRLRWGKTITTQSNTYWDQVIWADEKQMFSHSFGRSSMWVWGWPGESLSSACLGSPVQHSAFIMVWSCFSANGMGNLVKIDGHMDSLMVSSFYFPNERLIMFNLLFRAILATNL